MVRGFSLPFLTVFTLTDHVDGHRHYNRRGVKGIVYIEVMSAISNVVW
jgi:hypothetical protein